MVQFHSSRLEEKQVNIFSYFSMKTYTVDTHYKHLNEMLLISTCTNNICFHGEIRKISILLLLKKKCASVLLWLKKNHLGTVSLN